MEERKTKCKNTINHSEIKLMATDMDGTLLDSDKNLPDDFMSWVRGHKEVKTVIASGRQYFTLRNMFLPVKDQLIFIAENGSLVFEKEQILYSNVIKRSDVERCLECLDGISGVSLILCGTQSAYMKHGSDIVEENAHMYYAKLRFINDLYECLEMDDIVKIAVFVEEQKAEAFMKQFPDIGDDIMAVLSGDSWIDISNKTVNKGEAIKAVQSKYEILYEESMAFGDYLNDYELLLNCKESYAMENAHPKLKKIARHVTGSNDDQGVMQILRKLDRNNKM